MPNWSHNHVVFIAPTEELGKKIVRSIQSGNLLDTFHPTPREVYNSYTECKCEKTSLHVRDISDSRKCITVDEANALVEKYGAKDWYEWRTSNWGTKWDIFGGGIIKILKSSTEGDDNDSVIVIAKFDTAWSYPETFMSYIEKAYDIKVHAYVEIEGFDGFETYGDPYNFLFIDRHTTVDVLNIPGYHHHHIPTMDKDEIEFVQSVLNNNNSTEEARQLAHLIARLGGQFSI